MRRHTGPLAFYGIFYDVPQEVAFHITGHSGICGPCSPIDQLQGWRPIIDFDNNIIRDRGKQNEMLLVTENWIRTKLDGDCGGSFL